MPLELVRVVVARQVELLKPRHHAVVHDPNNVRLFQILRHPADGGAILRLRRATVALPVALHHFRQIEIDFVTGAVLHQRNTVAIANLAPDGGNADGRFGAALDTRRPFVTARHLHPPQPEEKGAQTKEHAKPEKLDAQGGLSAAHIH